jgi:hypothetical protein
MNKKIISVSLLASSSLFLAGCSNPFVAQNPGNQSPVQTLGEAAKFAAAIQSGAPTTCTLTKGQDTLEYVIKGKMMRANTTKTMTDDTGKAKTTVGHMINDTQFFYIWSDDQKQGSKMPIPSPLASSAPASPTAVTEPQAAAPKLGTATDYQNLQNEGYTINCKSGVGDGSAFTPPTDVKFIDPTEMMRAIPSPAADGKIDMQKIQELQKQYGGQ